ncbi:MAG: hypothetical protein Q9226_008910, partial [Calogaya cf. arnoldii]
VIITLRDREVRSELSELSELNHSQILRRIRDSIRKQRLNVIVESCDRHIGRRANFRLWTKDAEGARKLKKS